MSGNATRRESAPRCAAGCGRAPASSAGCWSCSWASCCSPSPGPGHPPAARPGRAGDAGRAGCSTSSSLQFLPTGLRPLAAVARRAAWSSCYGLWRLMGVLLEPFPPRDRAARRAGLPEALAGARAAHRGHRRRHRPVDAAARPEGGHQQHHRGRDRGRRRRLVGQAARGAGHRPRGRHPQLHRGARRRRADHDPAAPVPLPDRERRRPARSAATPSATCSSRRCPTSRATSRRASATRTACSRCAARWCRWRRRR